MPLRDDGPEPVMQREVVEDVVDEPVGDADAPIVGRGGFVAPAMLMVGLLVGFGGGFVIGQRMAPPSPPRSADVPALVTDESGPTSVDDAPLVVPADTAGLGSDSLGPASEPASRVEAPPAPNPPQAPVAAASQPGARRGTPPASPAAAPRAPTPAPAVRQAPAPATGTLQFDSRPTGASIYVNDVRVGSTPMTMRDVRPATYRVRLELPGHRPWTNTVTLEAGASVRVGASLE